MPTFITDLHMRHGKRYVQPWPGIVSGFTEFLQNPEFDIQESDVSASNQTRWDGRMKQLFDWGHLPPATPLDVHFDSINHAGFIYLNTGPPVGPYASNLPFVDGPASTHRHVLSELRRPFGTFPGDGDSDKPDPDSDHSHPDTYVPNFAIPTTGSFPYRCYLMPPASERVYGAISDLGSTGVVEAATGWMFQSQQNPHIGGTQLAFDDLLYEYGNFLSPTGVTPKGGYFLYGQYGESGSSALQSFDFYWIEPIFYKVHDRWIRLNEGGTSARGRAKGYISIDVYKELAPMDAWWNEDNWIQLFNPTGQDVVLDSDGSGFSETGPPGTYFYRLCSGQGAPSDGPQGYDTWEWRNEFRLFKTTPGQGFSKRREYAQVFPMMRLEEERETILETTTGIIREPRPDDQAEDKDEDDGPGLMEPYWIPPIPNYRTETDTRVRRKKIAEYGL